jgi:hypothetical protein
MTKMLSKLCGEDSFWANIKKKINNRIIISGERLDKINQLIEEFIQESC